MISLTHLRHLDRLNQGTKAAACFGLAALFVMGPASAQIAYGSTGIDATGDAKSEMAACQSGKTQQDRATCITEVRNANAAKRAGKLENGNGQFSANALKRCEVFKGEDQLACQARIAGEGKVQGSVASGGVLREVEITVPVTQ